MSMTREEAIKHLTAWIYTDFENMPKQVLEALNIAIAALRPVSREQVEKMEWEKIAESAWGKQYKCPICNIRTTDYSNFCPNCGYPMTDEAVNMVVERLEALKDES